MRGGTAVIAGIGHAEPVSVRGNDDPAFDWIKAHQPAGVDLFQGYVSRRVLAPDEDLIDILVPSARMAMDWCICRIQSFPCQSTLQIDRRNARFGRLPSRLESGFGSGPMQMGCLARTAPLFSNEA